MNNKLGNNPQRRAHGPSDTSTSYAPTINKLNSRVEEDVAMQNSLSSLYNSSSFNIQNLLVRPLTLLMTRDRVLVEAKPIIKPFCCDELRIVHEDSNRVSFRSSNISKLSARRFPSTLMVSTV